MGETTFHDDSVMAPDAGNVDRRKPPFWLMAVMIIFVCLSWVPLVLIAKAKNSISREPKVHFLLDMAHQPKETTQVQDELFADGREMRPKIFNTVAKGQAEEDDFFYRGYQNVPVNGQSGPTTAQYFPAPSGDAAKPSQQWPDDHSQKPDAEGNYPAMVVTEATLKRGQDRFYIYCTPCHGLDGSGNGAVNAREKGREPNWIQPSDLTADRVIAMKNGEIFSKITTGVRKMPSYAAQIPPEDRWAIVSYVRALELSQQAHPTVKADAPATMPTVGPAVGSVEGSVGDAAQVSGGEVERTMSGQ